MTKFSKSVSILFFCCLSVSSVSAENLTAPAQAVPISSPAVVPISTSPQANYEMIKMLRGYAGNILSLAFSPDGKLMAIGTSDQSVIIWDVLTWTEIKTLFEENDDVRTLAFSRDGKYLASGHEDDKVYLWDTSTWKKISSIRASDAVTSLSFNGDSTILAIARDNDKILLWDIKKGKAHKKLQGHNGDVKAVDYSPDGSRLASGSQDNIVIVWDAASGEKIQTLPGHINNVVAISYSPDGKYLVSGSNDNTIIIWDANTGNYINTLAGYTNSVCTVSFVPGSNILAAGDCIVLKGPFGIPIRHSGSACKVVFWDLESVKQINSIDGDCGLSSAAFSPDGKYFVTGHATGGRFITIYERK